MPVTMQQVRAHLDPDEPDYNQAARLGPDALPHLEALVRGGDAMLASKAASLAGLIADPRSADVLAYAAQSPHAAVRVAAAAAVAHLPTTAAAPVLRALLSDPDGEVRRIALESVHPDAGPELQPALEKIAVDDPYAALRQRSAAILARIRR
jgi:HEAT repeat protein